jgi:hypothetical protein
MRRIHLIILTVIIFALAVLPAQTTQAQAAQTCIPRADWGGTHTIARGENLYRIALKYNITWTVLAAGNCIADVNRIYVGQRLRVPGPVTNPPQYFKLPNRLVSVRDYPSSGATELASLANIEIMLLGRTQDSNWVYIQARDMTAKGWVWSYDTEIHASFITPLPVLINTGGNPNEIRAFVPGRYNRLRSGPTFNHRVITYVNDQTVTVRGRSADGLWLNVDVNGTGGWIYRELVQLEQTTVNALPIFGTD